MVHAEDIRPQIRFGRIPIPHEHGAWVILYAPMLIAVAAAGRFDPVPELLLLLAVTGAFLARNAVGLLLRGRGKDGVAGWLGVYVLLFAAGALPLLAAYRRYALLEVGAVVAGLFLVHAALTVWPSRERLDRSQWGELLAVGALAMTGPAAWVVATGRFPAVAWALWAACVLFFSSSIFNVKMLLSAVKVKGEPSPSDRWRLGRDTLIYHGLLTVILDAAAVRLGGLAGVLVALAYLPIVARALASWATLSSKLPPLKRVGLLETVYSLWFVALLIAVIRVG